MFSRCRSAALAAVLAAAGGCDREARDFRPAAASLNLEQHPPVSDLHAGPPPAPAAVTPAAYQDNRWAVGEGKRLYQWYNCAGCHSPGGGGGMGPPLIDVEWIYGSAPANVFASIIEGRPNGMPSFRDRVAPADAWKLVAYVRTLGRLTPRDVWPARGDEMAELQRNADEPASRSPPDVPASTQR